MAAAGVDGPIAFVAGPGADLFTIRPDGRLLRRLTHGPGSDDDPAWSPDGRTIAFDRTSGDGTVTSVYTVDPAGGQPRLLLRGARSPMWSLSGRRLVAFRSGAGSPNGGCPNAKDVWLVPFAGGTPRLVLTGAWSVAWSPSGRQLAAMRADGIWILTIATDAIHQLTTSGGRTSLDSSTRATTPALGISPGPQTRPNSRSSTLNRAPPATSSSPSLHRQTEPPAS
jgi:Tol biopolymer transport system component